MDRLPAPGDYCFPSAISHVQRGGLARFRCAWPAWSSPVCGEEKANPLNCVKADKTMIVREEPVPPGKT